MAYSASCLKRLLEFLYRVSGVKGLDAVGLKKKDDDFSSLDFTNDAAGFEAASSACLLYTSPSPRDS